MAGISSFDKLTRQYSQRIDKLVRCSQLLGVENCSSSLQLLTDINEEVTQLEELVIAHREALERDRSMVHDMKALVVSAQGMRHQLEHASQNLPGHLPDFNNRELSSAPSTANVSQSSSMSSLHTSESSSVGGMGGGDVMRHQPQAPAPVAPPQQHAEPVSLTNTAQSRKLSAMAAHALAVPTLAYITLAEFNDVPKYIRGRLAYDSVNMAVEELNKAYTTKYKLIAVPRAELSEADIKKRKSYKSQEIKDVEGKHFVTDHDIRTTTGFKLDTTGRGVLSVLRHCKRLKEVHGGGFVRYAIQT